MMVYDVARILHFLLAYEKATGAKIGAGRFIINDMGMWQGDRIWRSLSHLWSMIWSLNEAEHDLGIFGIWYGDMMGILPSNMVSIGIS